MEFELIEEPPLDGAEDDGDGGGAIRDHRREMNVRSEDPEVRDQAICIPEQEDG